MIRRLVVAAAFCAGVASLAGVTAVVAQSNPIAERQQLMKNLSQAARAPAAIRSASTGRPARASPRARMPSRATRWRTRRPCSASSARSTRWSRTRSRLPPDPPGTRYGRGVPIHDLTALEQGDAVRRGELSPLELVEHYAARADRVGAFVTTTHELAQ